MIPDKIYIPIHQSYPNAPIDEKNTHLGADWYVSKCDQTAVGFQEYIRKEALLEWANGEKKATEELIKEHPKDDSLWAEMHWYEKLIKHIGSL